jgi:AcrR family transcriptional regulator
MKTKQEQILNSALELFVTLGFHGTSTSAIAKHAWISNGIIFHYFKTKEDLITSLYISIKDELMESLQSETTSSTESYIKNILELTILWWVEYKNKYLFIQQIHFSPYIHQIPNSNQENYTKLYLDMVEAAKSDKIIKNLPTYLILSILIGQVNALVEYISNKMTYSKKDIEEWVDLIWEVIRI